MNDAAGQVGLVLLITGLAEPLKDASVNGNRAGLYSPHRCRNFIFRFWCCAYHRPDSALRSGINRSCADYNFLHVCAIDCRQRNITVLCGIAICAGGIGLSLPNDSGFWAINCFYKISAEDTIRAWTIGGFVTGVAALTGILSVFCHCSRHSFAGLAIKITNN